MFPGLGTLINVVAIIAGGLIGMAVGNRMPERMREALIYTNGIAVLFIGMAGALSGMLVLENGSLVSTNSMLVVISLVLGTFFGELANIDERVTRFGAWLKEKSGNSDDPKFVEGFVTASMTVAIGAMAVVGSVNDALFGDISVLTLKATLDCIIILTMTCTLGRGCAFSAVSVALVQGTLTVLALIFGPLMTDAALANLGLVGSILIFCVGINLVWGNRIRVLSMLPAILLAPVAAYLPMLF